MKWKTIFLSLETIYLPNVERKLQKMAAEGWLLNEVKNRVMIFESCEPQNIKYNVLINQTNEKEKTSKGPIGELEALCIEDGWEFLLRFGRFVIFTSRDENIVDIHTDPKIKIDIVSKQIFRLLKYEIGFLPIFIAIILFPLMTMKYGILYSSFFVQIFFFTILLFMSLSVIFITNLIWWGKNRRGSKEAIFEFSDTTYRIIMIIQSVTWAMTTVAIFTRTILQPLPGVDFGLLFLPLIMIAPFFLIFIWKRESENKLKIPKDLVGLIGLMLLILIFESFGGVTMFTGKIFSDKQAIRTSDLNNIEVQYYPLDNLPEIGLYAMKTVDATDFYDQDTLHTLILRFYSDKKAESYWNNRKKDLSLGGSISQEWGLTGYYFNDNKGIIIRKDLEIIEIDGFVDMMDLGVVSRIKARLGFSVGS